jgi:hypothetical protein
MYFPDLKLCNYGGGPYDAANWSVPLLAVGWLQSPHKFETGATPSSLIGKLKALAEQTNWSYAEFSFRGLHKCSFCPVLEPSSQGIPGSHVNLFVPGDGVVYAAPAAIAHYIEAHSYLAPAAFLEAAQQCPDCTSAAYRAALCASNNGIAPPFTPRREKRKYLIFWDDKSGR